MENVLVMSNVNFEKVTRTIGFNDHDIVVVIVDNKGIIHRAVDVLHATLPRTSQIPHDGNYSYPHERSRALFQPVSDPHSLAKSEGRDSPSPQ